MLSRYNSPQARSLTRLCLVLCLAEYIIYAHSGPLFILIIPVIAVIFPLALTNLLECVKKSLIQFYFEHIKYTSCVCIHNS